MNRDAVLIIDTDADSRRIYSKLLEHFGFRPLESASVEEGEPLLRLPGIAAVIVEPYAAGPERWAVIASLTASAAAERVPVLAVTSLAAERTQAIAAGCSGFLAKPCALRTVLLEVSRLISVN